MEPNDLGVEHAWTTHTVRPIVAVYVVAVFVCFMGLAHFVVHSADAVRALFLALIGAVVGTVPGILKKVEYRITETGLAKRPLRAKGQREFADVFAWDELSHLIPTSSGFKFYKRMPDTGPVSRFFKLHLSGGYAGELHADPPDRARVQAIAQRKGIPTSNPHTPRRVPSGGK